MEGKEKDGLSRMMEPQSPGVSAEDDGARPVVSLSFVGLPGPTGEAAPEIGRLLQQVTPTVSRSSLESPTKCTYNPHQASSGGLSASEGFSAKQLLHSSEWHRFHEIKKGNRVLVVGEYS